MASLCYLDSFNKPTNLLDAFLTHKSIFATKLYVDPVRLYTVDCVDGEIENFLSPCRNANVCRSRLEMYLVLTNLRFKVNLFTNRCLFYNYNMSMSCGSNSSSGTRIIANFKSRNFPRRHGPEEESITVPDSVEVSVVPGGKTVSMSWSYYVNTKSRYLYLKTRSMLIDILTIFLFINICKNV